MIHVVGQARTGWSVHKVRSCRESVFCVCVSAAGALCCDEMSQCVRRKLHHPRNSIILINTNSQQLTHNAPRNSKTKPPKPAGTWALHPQVASSRYWSGTHPLRRWHWLIKLSTLSSTQCIPAAASLRFFFSRLNKRICSCPRSVTHILRDLADDQSSTCKSLA